MEISLAVADVSDEASSLHNTLKKSDISTGCKSGHWLLNYILPNLVFLGIAPVNNIPSMFETPVSNLREAKWSKEAGW